MAKEDEKLDIDDIKEPEDGLDIEEAVSEESDSKNDLEQEDVEKEEETKKEIPEAEDDKDVLEKVVAETEPEKDVIKKDSSNKKRKFNWKIFGIVTVIILIVAAAVLGGIYYFMKYKKDTKQPETTTQETKTEESTEKPKTETRESGNYVYVNSETGLNLREEPNTSAKIIVIIPWGTKLPILEEKTGWYKTEYSGKQGWINKDYVQAKNPQIYENTEYGFSLTFPLTWGGYKLTKKTVDGVIVYYVGLPTTDKNWVESSMESGYASLFAISVYTKAQFTQAQSMEMPPSKLAEKGDYVFSSSHGQATPTDLADKFNDVNSIIQTFKVN